MDRNNISEHIPETLAEGWYDSSPHPHFSRSDTNRELGRNPLYTDNGNHSSRDRITQPSTIDFNGANFRGQNYIISDNAFMVYKIKNFGHDRHNGSMSMFSDTKDFRKALDLLYGGARRGGRSVIFRSFTPQSKAVSAKRNNYMSHTFWEFSLDGGQTWNVMVPNPLDKLRKSKMVVKSESQTSGSDEDNSIKIENIKRDMPKKIQMKKSEFARYVSESVKKVLNEIGETPQGQYMLGRLAARQAKRNRHWDPTMTDAWHYANKKMPDRNNPRNGEAEHDWWTRRGSLEYGAHDEKEDMYYKNNSNTQRRMRDYKNGGYDVDRNKEHQVWDNRQGKWVYVNKGVR